MHRWFYISRGERLGIIALGILAMTIGALVYWMRRQPADVEPISEQDRREMAAFDRAVAKQNARRRAKHGARGYHVGARTALFPFDPNTADSLTLLRLGLPSWQASNVLKYRRKGGRWRSARHFSRLYGLSEQDFRRLEPYIRITKTLVERPDTQHRRRYPVVKKFKQLTVLDLNAVDTATLRKIPGIGPFYARKIVEYGERLGGYVSVAQLAEVGGLPADIQKWFRVEQVPPRRLQLGKLTFKQLLRHPYLNYEQVKAIFEVRRKTGFANGWQSLLMYDCFTQADVERLTPYVAF